MTAAVSSEIANQENKGVGRGAGVGAMDDGHVFHARHGEGPSSEGEPGDGEGGGGCTASSSPE